MVNANVNVKSIIKQSLGWVSQYIWATAAATAYSYIEWGKCTRALARPRRRTKTPEASGRKLSAKFKKQINTETNQLFIQRQQQQHIHILHNHKPNWNEHTVSVCLSIETTNEDDLLDHSPRNKWLGAKHILTWVIDRLIEWVGGGGGGGEGVCVCGNKDNKWVNGAPTVWITNTK